MSKVITGECDKCPHEGLLYLAIRKKYMKDGSTKKVLFRLCYLCRFRVEGVE